MFPSFTLRAADLLHMSKGSVRVDIFKPILKDLLCHPGDMLSVKQDASSCDNGQTAKLNLDLSSYDAVQSTYSVLQCHLFICTHLIHMASLHKIRHAYLVSLV